MKYSINPCASRVSKTLSVNPPRLIWQACNNLNVMKEFETKAEAEKYIQSCVEDDAWQAANR